MSDTSRIDKLIEAMAQHALRYPEVTEGLACAGTPIESRTILTGKKAFLFLRRQEVRMKVADSLPQIEQLAAAHPDQYERGKARWIKISLEAGADPAASDWRRWIDESFRLFATRTRIKKLDAAPLSLG